MGKNKRKKNTSGKHLRQSKNIIESKRKVSRIRSQRSKKWTKREARESLKLDKKKTQDRDIMQETPEKDKNERNHINMSCKKCLPDKQYIEEKIERSNCVKRIETDRAQETRIR